MSTHNIPFSMQNRNQPKLTQICSYGIYFQGTQKNEFVTSVVNEPPVFEPAIEVLLYFCIVPDSSALVEIHFCESMS